MLEHLQTVASWLNALPGPTENWAKIIGDLAWPGVTLFLALRFRRPLRSIVDTLAERMGRDHIKLGNLLEITPNTTVIPLDPAAAAEDGDTFDPEDVKAIEEILEFAADSEANGILIKNWIASNVHPGLDPLDFLSDPDFAEERAAAYKDLIEGIQR